MSLGNYSMDNDCKTCKACKAQFEQPTGQWRKINGVPWFVYPCPACGVMLATQTQWFEVPTLESICVSQQSSA